MPNISGMSLALAGKSNAMMVITEKTNSIINAVIIRPLRKSLADILYNPLFFRSGRLPDIKADTANYQSNHNQRTGPE